MDNYLIQKLLKSYLPAYRKKHKLCLRELKAIEPQMRCRSKAQGFSLYRCPHDLSTKEIYHSCRHKGCTVCRESTQHRWLDKQQEQLLNCEHFHLVFTLPSEYHVLWLFNRKWFINTHFKVVNETLKTLLHEPRNATDQGKKHLGATPGYLSVLHTWGRQLNLHPHIHCVITAGGLMKSGEWKSCATDYLVPIRALKALYRGKFQSEIQSLLSSESLNLPTNQSVRELEGIHKQVYKKEWSVNIQKKYAHGHGVLKYLSRYLGASPIKPQQLFKVDHKKVLFRYKDHRDNKTKILSLKTEEFIRRYLVHQPESRVHSVRYYGLYASQSKEKYQKSRELLGETKQQKKTKAAADNLSTGLDALREVFCSCCKGVMQLSAVSYRVPRIKKSINKVIDARSALFMMGIGVQQGVQPDLLTQRQSVELTL